MKTSPPSNLLTEPHKSQSNCSANYDRHSLLSIGDPTFALRPDQGDPRILGTKHQVVVVLITIHTLYGRGTNNITSCAGRLKYPRGKEGLPMCVKSANQENRMPSVHPSTKPYTPAPLLCVTTFHPSSPSPSICVASYINRINF